MSAAVRAVASHYKGWKDTVLGGDLNSSLYLNLPNVTESERARVQAEIREIVEQTRRTQCSVLLGGYISSRPENEG